MNNSVLNLFSFCQQNSSKILQDLFLRVLDWTRALEFTALE